MTTLRYNEGMTSAKGETMNANSYYGSIANYLLRKYQPTTVEGLTLLMIRHGRFVRFVAREWAEKSFENLQKS